MRPILVKKIHTTISLYKYVSDDKRHVINNVQAGQPSDPNLLGHNNHRGTIKGFNNTKRIIFDQ